MSNKDPSKAAKLNQIVQNFHSKAAHVIVQSRIPVNSVYARGSSTPKINKWFNLELDETDAFRDELRLWRSSDAFDTTPIPPLVIETFLDARDMSPHQSLVLIDSNGKSWNVFKDGRPSEVVLERWIVEFTPESNSDHELPTIYKKCIILFRALYTQCRLLPTWSLRRKLSRSKLSVSPISVGCRVLNGAMPISSKGRIGLTKPIIDVKTPHLETFTFGHVSTAIGSLRISVSYRLNYDFKVSDSEALLSSHFLHLDRQTAAASASSTSPVALTSHQQPHVQSYHPIASNLRRNSPTSPSGGGKESPRALEGSGSGSYTSVHQMARKLSTGSKSSVKSIEDYSPSHVAMPKPPVSFIQPFKSPSLSASPSDNSGTNTVTNSGSRPQSFSRLSSNSSLAMLRNPASAASNTAPVVTPPAVTNRSSSSAVSTTAARNIPGSLQSNEGSSAGSKYSSSFGSRGQWARSSSIGRSSRPQSYFEPSSVSSNASDLLGPGSGLYLDDDDLGNFVKMVDSARLLKDKRKSLSSSSSSEEVKNPLAKFQTLRGNHAALTDSLQSSLYAPREVSPTNAALSSSPQGRGSNYTPLVPSRLSEEYTVDSKQPRYAAQPRRLSSKSSIEDRLAAAALVAQEQEAHTESAMDEDTIESDSLAQDFSVPLTIPQSPYRRESMSVSNSNTRNIDHNDLRSSLALEVRHASLGHRPRNISLLDDNNLNEQGLVSPSKRKPSYYMDDRAVDPEDALDGDDLLFAMSDMHVANKDDDNNNTYDPLDWDKS